MKTLFCILSLLTATSVLAQKDIRMVGGKTVDLTPVRDYDNQTKKEGERPLKFWKRIRIDSIGPVTSGMSTCTVTIEEGGTKSLVLKNIPAATQKAWTDLEKVNEDVKKLTDEIAENTKRVRTLQAKTANLTPDDSISAAQIQAATTATANLQNSGTDLATLQTKQAAAAAAYAAVSTEYAMFSGTKAGELEVWDCGIKK